MISLNNFDELVDFIIGTDKIQTVNLGGFNGRVNPADVENAKICGFSDEFIAQYKEIGSFVLSWRSKVPDTAQVVHSIRVKPLNEIIEHKDCSLFDEDDLEMNPAVEEFYVVDDFVEEACVGIYASKHTTKTLYFLVKGEWEPISTGLDLAGYYEMYLEAKGFFYWQKVIIQELILGNVIPAGDRMRHDLPLIFPEWSWENFVAKFKSLYIKELIP